MLILLVSRSGEQKRILEDLYDKLNELKGEIRKLKQEQIIQEPRPVAPPAKEYKQTEEKLHKSISMIDDSIKEIRNISHNMMPATLQHFGIIKAIEEFTDRMNLAGKSNINFEYFEVDEDKFL